MLSIVAAMARNRVIGLNNSTPWHLPSDLKFFRKITTGNPVVLGRKTYESIGHPLPGRENIVISSKPGYEAEGCHVVSSIDEALDKALTIAGPDAEIMIVGGGMIYEQALPIANRVYLSVVEAEIEGDTFFPELPAAQWHEVWRESFPADDRHAYPHTRCLLERTTA